MRRFLIPVLVTMWTLPAGAADRSRAAIPMAVDAHGGVLVSVRVNDAGPFPFLLDTGAARSIVADDLARELGAPVVAKSEVVTSVGSDMRFVVRLRSMAVASSRVDDILAPVVPAVRLSQLGRGVRGLLGQDFLSAFNYTLDYRRGRLTWDEPLTCDAPGAVRLVAAEGRFLMALDDDRGTPLRLVPDSGAEVLVLFRPIATTPSLRVGAATLRGVKALVVDRDDPGADGLLPLHGFSSVSFAAGGTCLVARG
jgi:hypothetical protein